MTTVVHVKGDASGTIDQRLVFRPAALAQMKQLATLGGSAGEPFDPISEEQARADAAKLGPGASYVSSTAIDDETGKGRATVYAFADVNQLRLSQQPAAPGGMKGRAQGVDTEGQAITFGLTRQPNGNALLTIAVPQPQMPGGGAAPPPDQLAMMKQLFSGARVTIAVEPAGTLVRTNSAFVDGQRVTLLDVDVDAALQDETFLPRVHAARTVEELKAVLKGAPGVKINFDREITIEFTPAR